MTSFLRALPRLLDPDPEADPMEHPALTREQVEAMDETMTFSTHRVTQMHRRRELADHFAPGVIEKHERVTWVDVALVLAAYVAGAAVMGACLAFGAWLAGALIGWGFEVLTGIEWATVAQLLGVKR